jgi:hypothetical protein
MIVRGSALDKAIETFVRYLESGSRKPAYWTKDKETRESSTPVELIYLRGIANHYGFSKSKILNMPLLEAKYYYAGWLEHERAIEFGTEKDTEVERRKAAMKADLEAQGVVCG